MDSVMSLSQTVPQVSVSVSPPSSSSSPSPPNEWACVAGCQGMWHCGSWGIWGHVAGKPAFCCGWRAGNLIDLQVTNCAWVRHGERRRGKDLPYSDVAKVDGDKQTVRVIWAMPRRAVQMKLLSAGCYCYCCCGWMPWPLLLLSC